MKWIVLMLLCPAIVFAGEECSSLGGVCREACAAGEEAAVGAFLDCSDQEECCVPVEKPKDNTNPSGAATGTDSGDQIPSRGTHDFQEYSNRFYRV